MSEKITQIIDLVNPLLNFLNSSTPLKKNSA